MTRAEKRKENIAVAKATIDGLVSAEMVLDNDKFLGVKTEDLDKDDLIKILAWLGFRKKEDNRNNW